MSDTIRQLASRAVYRNDWMSLREDEVEFPNGTTGRYAVVDKPDFVIVLARENGGFWMVQQYRYPIGRREWEFPQGGWPAGRSGTSVELAAAELREETGIRALEFRRLGRLNAAHGFCSQGYEVFLATGLTAGSQDLEDTESDLIARWRPEAEIRTMIADGTLADAHSVAALALHDLAERDRT